MEVWNTIAPPPPHHQNNQAFPLMLQGACTSCSCRRFVQNHFKPRYCRDCQHDHTSPDPHRPQTQVVPPQSCSSKLLMFCCPLAPPPQFSIANADITLQKYVSLHYPPPTDGLWLFFLGGGSCEGPLPGPPSASKLAQQPPLPSPTTPAPCPPSSRQPTSPQPQRQGVEHIPFFFVYA